MPVCDFLFLDLNNIIIKNAASAPPAAPRGALPQRRNQLFIDPREHPAHGSERAREDMRLLLDGLVHCSARINGARHVLRNRVTRQTLREKL